MMNTTTILEYAHVKYFAMRDAIKGIIKDFSVTNLADVKKLVDQTPTVEDVQSLEQNATKMILEINRIKEVVKQKDETITKSQSLLEAAYEDVVRMGSICEVLGVVLMNSNLYEAKIKQSEVFKSETFRKFMKATVTYT